MDLSRISLSLVQTRRKAVLEEQIARGVKSFIEVGNALTEIRDERLYSDEYDTFEDYIRERWQISRQQGYRLIAAASAAETCHHVVTLPSEGTARPLTALEPPDQIRAAKILKKSGRPITAKTVQSAVAQVTARGGLAAEARQAAPADVEGMPYTESLPRLTPAASMAALAHIEAWYAKERMTLNEYPVASPERMMALIRGVLTP